MGKMTKLKKFNFMSYFMKVGKIFNKYAVA